MCSETSQPEDENASLIQLGEDGQRRFAELLANPPVPTEAMKALGALPNLEFRRGDVFEKIDQQEFESLLRVLTRIFVTLPEGWDARKWLTDWMARPVPALGWRTPMDVLMQPGGKERVEKVLQCMGSGAFL